MRIGELARRTGISERALRYYEEQGLLAPQRRPSGYREYASQDIRTVRNIRTLLAAGLNTATIAELLPCMVSDEEVLAPACAGLVPVLMRDRSRITSAIDDLQATRALLDAVIAAAGLETPERDAACPAPVEDHLTVATVGSA